MGSSQSRRHLPAAPRLFARWRPRDVRCCSASLLPRPWSLQGPPQPPSPDSASGAGCVVAETPQTGPTLWPLLSVLEVGARGQGVRAGRLRRGPSPPSRVLPEERRWSLLLRDTNSTAGPNLLTSSTPNYLPEAPRPDILWVMGEGTVPSTANPPDQDSWPHSTQQGPRPCSRAGASPSLLCVHHAPSARVETVFLCSSHPGLCTQWVPHKCRK